MSTLTEREYQALLAAVVAREVELQDSEDDHDEMDILTQAWGKVRQTMHSTKPRRSKFANLACPECGHRGVTLRKTGTAHYRCRYCPFECYAQPFHRASSVERLRALAAVNTDHPLAPNVQPETRKQATP